MQMIFLIIYHEKNIFCYTQFVKLHRRLLGCYISNIPPENSNFILLYKYFYHKFVYISLLISSVEDAVYWNCPYVFIK